MLPHTGIPTLVTVEEASTWPKYDPFDGFPLGISMFTCLLPWILAIALPRGTFSLAAFWDGLKEMDVL